MGKIKDISLEEEFQKNPELKQADINAFREWVQKQPHLPKISDVQLALFLHSCYYRIEDAKVALDTFYTVRTKWSELVSNRTIKDKGLSQAMSVQVVSKLEAYSLKEGNRVLILGLVDKDPSRYVHKDIIRQIGITIDLIIRQYGSANGEDLIVDANGFTISHMLKWNLVLLKKGTIYLQEALPIRLQRLRVVNPPPFMDRILQLLKPLMKKELYDLIHIHSNINDLYKYYDKDLLPTDLGGNGDSYKKLMEKERQLFMDNIDWFENDAIENRVDESKRTGKPHYVDQLFGVEGSFKKLELD